MSTEKKNKLLNLKREPLTPDKLRELSSLNLSDKQADEVIESLTRFAWVLCNFTVQQRQSDEGENENYSLEIPKTISDLIIRL